MKDDIKVILDTWTTQPGYPVLHVDVEENALNLKQERFFIRQRKDDNINTKWHIPITWASFDIEDYRNTTPKQWMSEETLTIPTDNLVAILNVQQSGKLNEAENQKHD